MNDSSNIHSDGRSSGSRSLNGSLSDTTKSSQLSDNEMHEISEVNDLSGSSAEMSPDSLNSEWHESSSDSLNTSPIRNEPIDEFVENSQEFIDTRLMTTLSTIAERSREDGMNNLR